MAKRTIVIVEGESLILLQNLIIQNYAIEKFFYVWQIKEVPADFILRKMLICKFNFQTIHFIFSKYFTQISISK